mmetsp:Transcript_117455/g.336970  ORF Transcript_117455/g.336970 Transcript_117455/m.336970 type:complete len:209 (-) Transcript_117455:51-677(-)
MLGSFPRSRCVMHPQRGHEEAEAADEVDESVERIRGKVQPVVGDGGRAHVLLEIVEGTQGNRARRDAEQAEWDHRPAVLDEPRHVLLLVLAPRCTHDAAQRDDGEQGHGDDATQHVQHQHMALGVDRALRSLNAQVDENRHAIAHTAEELQLDSEQVGRLRDAAGGRRSHEDAAKVYVEVEIAGTHRARPHDLRRFVKGRGHVAARWI